MYQKPLRRSPPCSPNVCNIMAFGLFLAALGHYVTGFWGPDTNFVFTAKALTALVTETTELEVSKARFAPQRVLAVALLPTPVMPIRTHTWRLHIGSVQAQSSDARGMEGFQIPGRSDDYRFSTLHCTWTLKTPLLNSQNEKSWENPHPRSHSKLALVLARLLVEKHIDCIHTSNGSGYSLIDHRPLPCPGASCRLNYIRPQSTYWLYASRRRDMRASADPKQQQQNTAVQVPPHLPLPLYGVRVSAEKLPEQRRL